MANIKLVNHNWETSGVYDITQAKTQRQINAAISDFVSIDLGIIQGADDYAVIQNAMTLALNQLPSGNHNVAIRFFRQGAWGFDGTGAKNDYGLHMKFMQEYSGKIICATLSANGETFKILDDNGLTPDYRLKDKQIAIYGDSWCADYHGALGSEFISKYTGKTVHIQPDPGGTLLRIYSTKWDNYVADIYVISGGLNDVGANTTIASFIDTITAFCSAIRRVNSNAEIYFIAPPMMRTDAVHQHLYPLELYRIAIYRMAGVLNYNVINALKWTDVQLETDNTHPIVDDSDKIGKHIVTAISNYGDEETHINDYCNIAGILPNSQLRYFCDGGQLYLNLNVFDQPAGNDNLLIVTLPYDSGPDISEFSTAVMSGDVQPIFIIHQQNATYIALYKKGIAYGETIYVNGAFIPVSLKPTLFTNQLQQ